MKALFIGLGSIGQRHLRNLKILLPDCEIIAYRSSKQVPVLDPDNNPIANISLSKFYNIKEYETLDNALSQKPEIVFVTNPSKMHGPTTIAALQTDAYVFIEKPLSCDINSAKTILEIENQSNKKRCFVGFQYRYNPTLIQLKKILNQNIIGKIINVQIANGEYLPYWHPYEDYRKSYAAKKQLGGGAILTQIHDFDYSIYLFGLPKSLYAIGGKLSNLNIDVEDCVNISTIFNYKNSNLPVNINLDYISWPSRRYIKLYGENGSINCDLNSNKINVMIRETKKNKIYDFSSTKRNDVFFKELSNFISFVKGEEEPKVDIKEGIKSLEFALAVKSSLAEGKPFFFT